MWDAHGWNHVLQGMQGSSPQHSWDRAHGFALCKSKCVKQIILSKLILIVATLLLKEEKGRKEPENQTSCERLESLILGTCSKAAPQGACHLKADASNAPTVMQSLTGSLKSNAPRARELGGGKKCVAQDWFLTDRHLYIFLTEFSGLDILSFHSHLFLWNL